MPSTGMPHPREAMGYHPKVINQPRSMQQRTILYADGVPKHDWCLCCINISIVEPMAGYGGWVLPNKYTTIFVLNDLDQIRSAG